MCLLISLIIFLLVIGIWSLWAYFIFRYDYARVNSKILKRYNMANPDSYNKESEDIKSANLVYNSDKTKLTADIIIFDKKTLTTIRQKRIVLNVSERCHPISPNCIKL
jgi:hypothetical protein